MNSNNITKVALKVFSIYIMVHTILAIPSFFNIYVMFGKGEYTQNNLLFTGIAFASIVALIVLALFIWKLSVSFSSQINQEASSSSLSESFILSVLGLYLAFDGLTRMSFSSVNFYYSRKTSDTDIMSDIQIQTIIYLSVSFVQVIIGVTLVIKSEGWSALLRKLRVAGTN